MKFPYGMTASGKDSIRSKAEKMRPLSSAPMAVNRMKALYRLRKNKNQEYNPTDAADRSAGWYLQSLSSDSACDYYCEEKHYTSSGDTNCKDQVSKATLKTGYLTDAELKLSLMKPHSCSRNCWVSKVPQSKSEGNLMDVALYAMSSASFCSTVSGTSTDCESYGASSRSKSRSGSSCNSDDEEANYDFSQILLELDREERSDSETD